MCVSVCVFIKDVCGLFLSCLTELVASYESH